MREGQQTERMAGVVSLLSIFSFNVTVGLWAGFYANWLAVAEAYLFLATLIVFFRTVSVFKFVIMTALSLSMLLTHPWTGVMVLTVAALFVVSIWRDARKTILVKPILLFLVINIVVDVAKSLFFGGLAAAQDVSLGLSAGSFSLTLGLLTYITIPLFVYSD